MSHKEQIIIGIDPDVDRNGIAMLDMSTHSLQVQMLTFPNLLDFKIGRASCRERV